MKSIILYWITFVVMSAAASNVSAQTAADEAAVKAFWKEVWRLYENGSAEEVLNIYADNATSITPDGRLQMGKAAMRADWEAFKQMTDAPPKFSYEEPVIRVISPGLAIVNYATQADIRVGGQQVGGKMLGIAVLHKVNGKWRIEADSMTPVMEMPGGN